MYKGFNLTIDENEFFEYTDVGSQIHRRNKASIKNCIDSFKNSNSSLNAAKITADWFPNIRADVFLSHSHKDAKLAINIAGWLFNKFQLTAFVDSCVWGHSDELLQLVDDAYCWQPENLTYSYTKRNRSTSHIHMMLSVALLNTINNCECVIFLNTPSSIPTDQFIEGTKTNSPWIFSEISMTRFIQRRSPERPRKALAKLIEGTEELTVEYDVYLSHLKNLSKIDLDCWELMCGLKDTIGPEALDILYNF